MRLFISLFDNDRRDTACSIVVGPHALLILAERCPRAICSRVGRPPALLYLNDVLCSNRAIIGSRSTWSRTTYAKHIRAYRSYIISCHRSLLSLTRPIYKHIWKCQSKPIDNKYCNSLDIYLFLFSKYEWIRPNKYHDFQMMVKSFVLMI